MEIFDSDESGSVDFKEFISALTIFSNPEMRAEKLHCKSLPSFSL
jgi:Ca2+-binding EF-hand superfamily protein